RSIIAQASAHIQRLGSAAAMEHIPESSHGRHGRGPMSSNGTAHWKGQVRRPNHRDHSDDLGGLSEDLGSSRASIAATKPSNVKGPSKRGSSMKKVGVPLPPLRPPPRASSRIFGAYSPVSRTLRSSASGRPRSFASSNNRGTPRRSWF